MKLKHILLVALLGFFVSTALAANVEKRENPAVSTKDQFLQFLADKAMTYTDKVEDAIGASIDFAKQEAEPTMREFLVWRSWKHGVTAATPMFFIGCGLFGIWFFRRGWVNAKKNNEEMDGWIICFVITLVLTFIVGGITCAEVILPNTLSFIQIQVAPRIYLIEEVSKLIR